MIKGTQNSWFINFLLLTFLFFIVFLLKSNCVSCISCKLKVRGLSTHNTYTHTYKTSNPPTHTHTHSQSFLGTHTYMHILWTIKEECAPDKWGEPGMTLKVRPALEVSRWKSQGGGWLNQGKSARKIPTKVRQHLTLVEGKEMPVSRALVTVCHKSVCILRCNTF